MTTFCAIQKEVIMYLWQAKKFRIVAHSSREVFFARAVLLDFPKIVFRVVHFEL